MLVDSEVISCRAQAEVLTRHGYPISAEDMRQLPGLIGQTLVRAGMTAIKLDFPHFSL